MNAELQTIYEMIRARRFTEARHALEDYLVLHDGDADAWYLRSFVEPDIEQKIAALQHALKLDPKNAKARERLDKLKAEARGRRPPSAVPLILIFALIILLVVLGFVYLFQNNPLQPPEPTIPAVLQIGDALATDEATAEAAVNTEATAEAAAPSATPRPSETPVPPTETANPTSTTIPTSRPSATPIPTTEAAEASTNTPAPSPTRQPSATPTDMVLFVAPGDTGVLINAPQSVDVGEMRIIEVARPAETAIEELGGSVPAPGAGQEWVLVEALLECKGGEDCIVSRESITLLDGSGAIYPVASEFDLQPIFGTTPVGGQLWGYLGFTVPAAATDLRLVITQGERSYVFSLEERLEGAPDDFE